MQLGLSARACRIGLNLYLAWVAVVTLLYGLLNARIQRSWSISDWLINYQGGFVRRGLAGEGAYLAGRLLHLSPVGMVVALYLALYAVLLLAVRSLAIRSSWNIWVLALLLSPATLSFQILDAGAGFRKESLYLAALAIFVLLLRAGRLSALGGAIYIAISLVVAVLCHESLICFAPYFFAALVLSGRTVMQAATQCIVPFGLALAAAWLCARHLGDLQAAAQICASLGYQLLPQNNQICSGGAIGYLGYTRQMAREETRAAVAQYHFYRFYAGLAVLALAPLVLGSRKLVRAGFGRQVRLLWLTSLAAFLASMVLFVYAVDWGRWIYIHVVSLMLLLLFLDSRAQMAEGTAPEAERIASSKPWSQPAKLAAAAVLFLYAALWTLPHVPMEAPRYGYIGMADYLTWYVQGHLHRHPGSAAKP